MNNDAFKIGYVVEVRGQKINIKVFVDKNGPILLYDGTIIKNVSVGSYVKIPKGFSAIIAKIEGEYIKRHEYDDGIDFHKENQEIDRIIEVSILGVLEDDKFKRGIIEIPLVMSEVFILSEPEMQQIFQFTKNKDGAITLGTINDYRGYNLSIDAESLFASHIGIFGNTGSGKSNTLAKMYTECFNVFGDKPGFENSKFIVIDFNGEYENGFTDDNAKKKCYKLSTREDVVDNKIPIGADIFQDIDIWSILCEATEKTQRPFLNRALGKYRMKSSGGFSASLYIKDTKLLLIEYVSNPMSMVQQKGILKELYSLILKDASVVNGVLSKIEFHNQNQIAYISDWGSPAGYLNSEQRMDKLIQEISANITPENIKENQFIGFEYTVLFNYLLELARQYIYEEHIAPFIKRFSERYLDFKKIFKIEETFNLKTFTVCSLFDVNIRFKKIAPLILCKYYYDDHKKKYATQNDNSLHIIVDEAHNILSETSERESQTWKDYRLETFEEIIKEGRKFGVFLTIASQRPSDISDTIISQLHNYFIHRLVNSEDLRAIGRAVSFIDKASFEMIPVLPQGACIFSGISSNFPVLIQVDMLEKELQPNSNTIPLLTIWNQTQ